MARKRKFLSLLLAAAVALSTGMTAALAEDPTPGGTTEQEPQGETARITPGAAAYFLGILGPLSLKSLRGLQQRM